MRAPFATLLATLAFAWVSPVQGGEPSLRHVRPDRASGGSAAVVVGEDAALVHTTQIFPPQVQDEPESEDRQIELVLNRLDVILSAAKSGMDRVVKLHVVVERADLIPKIREAFVKRIADHDGPAWTVVVGELARPGAILAIDAVATTDAKPAPGRVEQLVVRALADQLPGATFATISAGRRVFISGQAEPDADLAAATRKTLESLEESLKHLGMGKEHIAQLKAFYLPADSAEIVWRETTQFFGEAVSPPLVLVEWKSSSSLPIEIELVAFAPDQAPEGAEAVEYLTPPGLTPSPVFSRIARVNRGDLVFVSGLTGPEGASGAEQVEAIFAELKAILDEAGSDFRHMAKATYYVADNEASVALNELRPNHYDPARPPAASKAIVPGTGSPGRSVEVDMIAVGKP